jgi:MOSC domain-containing protein YiiM
MMMSRTVRVVSVNVSPGGIPKTPLDVAVVKTSGIVGDEHNHEKHNTPMQALCLFDMAGIEELKREGYALRPGAIGENVTLDGIDVDELDIGDRLRFSGGVEVEITKRRTPCYVLDAIDETLKKTMVGRSGVYAKILTEGELRPGETVEVMRGAGVGAES